MKLFQTTISLLGLFYLLIDIPALAQITPDATVGTQIIKGTLNDIIEGGAVRGNNLFHSFSEFNINSGHGAYFTNPINVTNIFTRVTGINPSNIDGTLGVLGSANLFFMNPNGIIFGNAAKLDLKGSFLGTTASSIKFADGSEFNTNSLSGASNSAYNSLLTVSIPVGLGFGSNSGSIINKSTATDNNGQIVGLKVQPGKTLGLVGNNLLFPGGNLTTSAGQIELGSVSKNSDVNLSQNTNGFNLAYNNVNNFADIQLTNSAKINTSGAGGGSIQVQGRLFQVRDGSQIIAQTQGSQPGKALRVNASELIELSGTAPDVTKKSADGLISSGLFTTTLNTGNAGEVIIDTGKLSITGGAVINTITSGRGNAGRVTINATEIVGANTIGYTNEFNRRLRSGTTSWFDYRNGIWTLTQASGNAGSIDISTNNLILRDGTRILSTSVGRGNAASLKVNARDGVEASGATPDGEYTSGLFSASIGLGAGADLTVDAKRLVLQNGGTLTSATSGAGAGGALTVNASELIEIAGDRSGFTSGAGLIRLNGQVGNAPAGNITVNTQRLILRDGGQIFTATGGASAGGVLTINASSSVEVKGVSATGRFSGILGDARASGNAGAVQINTRSLIISDKGRVAVGSTGTGNAGNIEIVADSVRLNNGGTINAATKSGEGGNIILQANTLQLRNNSSISATAGNNGDGGNINLNVGAIAQLSNSDITANAQKGKGGNIDISTQAIFRSFDSDITASSELGINGTVNITAPDIKQDSSLKEQASNFVDAEQVVANSCLASRNTHSGKFVITGNGGIAETPNNTNMPYELAQVKPVEINKISYEENKNTRGWKLGDAIIEAKRLHLTSDGRMALSATSDNDNLLNAQSLTC